MNVSCPLKTNSPFGSPDEFGNADTFLFPAEEFNPQETWLQWLQHCPRYKNSRGKQISTTPAGICARSASQENTARFCYFIGRIIRGIRQKYLGSPTLLQFTVWYKRSCRSLLRSK